MKSLVVFYSLTDKTKLVSQAIAEALNAELVEIEETKLRRRGFLTYLTGGFSAVTNKGSEIKPTNVDLKQYETIFIGSPVWASRPTPAVNSFIYTNNFEGKSIVPFFTMGSNNSNKALENIKTKIEKSQGRVIGSFAIKTYGISDDEIISRAKEAIKNCTN
jgi:flavodoxin